MKTVLFTFLFLIITFTSYSQPLSPEALAYIEAHGSAEGITGNEGPNLEPPTTWTQTADAPNAYGRVSAGVIGNFLYVFCSQLVTSMAAAYNLTTNVWVASTPATASGSNIGAVVANGQLYKCGTVFEKFLPAGDGTGTWTVLTPAPTQIRGAENSLAWDGNDYIYANGGTTTNYFYRYKISTDTWETNLAVPPVANRRYAGMVFINNVLYRIGGLGETNWDGTLCHKYTPGTDTWDVIAPLPEAVNFTKWQTTTDGRYVYLIGSGGGFSPYTVSQNCYMYDYVTNTWTLENVLPAGRGLALGIYLPGNPRLFWGGGNDGTSGTSYQLTNYIGTGGPYTPVEFTSFTSQKLSDGVLLKWSTATETNNRGFAVERSSDKIGWSFLGFINGSGTTTAPNTYSYIDRTTESGNYYYRLKQLDMNGKYEYSTVIEVIFTQPGTYQLAQNFPNPFNPSTSIKYTVANPGLVQLFVYNLLGQEVKSLVNEFKEAGTYEISFNASELSTGTYFYKLETPQFSKTMKMLLTK